MVGLPYRPVRDVLSRITKFTLRGFPAESLCYPQIIHITTVQLTAAIIHLRVSFSSPRLRVSSWCS
jgi:hypothetical protein